MTAPAEHETEHATPLLEARELRVDFPGPDGSPRAVVRDASLAITPGASVALVGPSGSGKSSLALGLLGLLPDAATARGEVRFDGRALERISRKELRRRTALLLQDPVTSLDPRMRAADQIEEPLLVHRLGTRAERRHRVDELLGLLGLTRDEGRRFPHELSGGQAQRVALARALAPSPDLLVLDEPTTGLDLSIRARLLNLLADLRREMGLTLLLITHDLAVASPTCPRTLVMSAGRLVDEGPTPQVLRRLEIQRPDLRQGASR